MKNTIYLFIIRYYLFIKCPPLEVFAIFIIFSSPCLWFKAKHALQE